MPRFRLAHLALFGLIGLMALPPLATGPLAGEAQARPKIQGIYSNLDPGETAGVLTGMEVFIIPYIEDEAIRHMALVQFTDTIPERPQLVDLTVDGRTVSFVAQHPEQGEVRFEGEVAPDSLSGRFDKLGEVDLPKGESLWQWTRGEE